MRAGRLEDDLELPNYSGALDFDDDDLIIDPPEDIFDSDIYIDDRVDLPDLDYGGEPPTNI